MNQKLCEKMITDYLAGDLEKDTYGGYSLARLLFTLGDGGKSDGKEAGDWLGRLARWFELPHPTIPGRGPEGEPDFVAHKLVRACYSAEEKLSQETRELIRKFFTEHDFESKYKSENHMLLFHEARYLYALRYPETVFFQYNKTAAEALKEDRNFLQEFIRFRAQRGWAEFDSCGYAPEDFTALLSLYDFGEPQMRHFAEMSANLLLMDMLMDCSKEGYYGGAHGRVYEEAVFDHRNSGMYVLYSLYFGEDTPDGAYLEPLVSEYVPGDYVYELFRSRPESWENRESKHLHSITYETPHRQVPQVPGSINKRILVTPDYMIGGVTWQDDYPAGSPAAWYAHHQQHEWELTLLTGPDVRIFTHHPGGAGPEGKEHGYWTGDLACCCGQFFSHGNIAMATYDIPEKEMQFIHASVPFNRLETEREGNYLWMKASGRVYAMLWFSQGIGRGGQGMEEIEVRSYGRRHGVVCMVATEEEYGSYEVFKETAKANRPEFDPGTMTLSYSNLKMNRTERLVDGRQEVFPYDTYDSLCMHSAFGSGIIETERVSMDFNGWGKVVYKEAMGRV